MQQDDSESQPSLLTRPQDAEQVPSNKSRVAAIMDLQNLQCLLCMRKFKYNSLHRHMGSHIDWYRCRCKLCDYKCFFKCDCVAHCNRTHKARNNRALLAEMVIQMSHGLDKYVASDEEKNEENDENDEEENDEENDEEENDEENDEEMTDDSGVEKETDSSLEPLRYEGSDESNDARAGVAMQSDEEVTRTEELVTDSCTDIEYETIVIEDTDEAVTTCRNLEEYMACSNPGKLDAYPDLKRMVMEVILGSSDAHNTAEPADSEKRVESYDSNKAERDAHTNNNENNNVAERTDSEERMELDASDEAEGDTYMNNNENNAAERMDSEKRMESYGSNEAKGDVRTNNNENNNAAERTDSEEKMELGGSDEAEGDAYKNNNESNNAAERTEPEERVESDNNKAEEDAHMNNSENNTVGTSDTGGTTYHAMTDSSKPQRPMRKRIKPVYDDFVYDLKQMQIRRETSKGSSLFQLGRSSVKHHLNFDESDTLMNARKKAKLYKKTLRSD